MERERRLSKKRQPQPVEKTVASFPKNGCLPPQKRPHPSGESVGTKRGIHAGHFPRKIRPVDSGQLQKLCSQGIIVQTNLNNLSKVLSISAETHNFDFVNSKATYHEQFYQSIRRVPTELEIYQVPNLDLSRIIYRIYNHLFHS